MSETLTEFLLARIAEDEAMANDAYGFLIGSRWWEKTEHGRVYAGHWVPVVGVTSYDEPADDDADIVTHQGLGMDSLAHIARWDPARVLVECEAKRAIVARHCPYEQVFFNRETQEMDSAGPACEWCGGHEPGIQDTWPCLDLCALALPYAEHPSYDEAWRP